MSDIRKKKDKQSIEDGLYTSIIASLARIILLQIVT